MQEKADSLSWHVLNSRVLPLMVLQAPHLQSFKPIRKDLFQSLEKKKLPDKHRPQPNLSKDRQTHLSPRTKSTIIKRSVFPELHCVYASSNHPKNKQFMQRSKTVL